jgi:hypothetical protein
VATERALSNWCWSFRECTIRSGTTVPRRCPRLRALPRQHPENQVTEHRREDRALAWLNRNRRLARDFEATVESAITWLYFASVKLMLRRPPAA